MSETRFDPHEIAAGWVENFEGELVDLRRLPPRDAMYASLDPPLPQVLRDRLETQGIKDLYRHQTKAIGRLREGKDLVVVAGTASGKTLCYQVPIIEKILSGEKATSLCIYPTKALAQDQLRSFRTFRIPGMVSDTYDGDTLPGDRARIRKQSNVVLTNPDMLHVGILPFHDRWADFFHRLQFVVVDEMHTLKGVFGTHVAMILRRLRRIAAHYGANPTFVFGSATIGNPEELGTALSGKRLEVIAEDASPQSEKWMILWNPEILDPETNKRRSALSAATDIFVDLVRHGLHTIAFTRSRRGTELMFRWASERVEKDSVAPYRAGYLAADRRRIEERLFKGDLAGVIATNALELGIDVGDLDAAVLTTFPGTISSFLQQVGRAGRRLDGSLVALVGGEDALDQYFMMHPDELFSRLPEAAVINPANPYIAEAHAACAAYEIPLRLADREFLGEAVEEAANRLVQAGHLHLKGEGLFWARRKRPAPGIDIRSSGRPRYSIIADGEAIGTLEEDRAFRDAHVGAVYLHQGESYLVERLDTEAHQVWVTQSLADYYTQPKVEKHLEILDVESERSLGLARQYLGRVRVESHVVAFQQKRLGNREVIDTIPLDLPPTVFETEAVWITAPDDLLSDAGLDERVIPGALHAAEHAAIGMLPILAVCDRWDIGGLSTRWHPQAGMATVFIYEGYAGGAGISPVAFSSGPEHLRSTAELIRSCPCLSGCPSCIQSPKCGNFNEPLDKEGAVRLIEALLDFPTHQPSE